MRIRELPPLRLHDEIITPSGKRYRWGMDEPNAANRPSRRRDSSTIPGGYETADGTLARKPGIDYSDLERLSTWRRIGASGEVAWEGRLERAPRVSGEQMAISPSAVGWQAHLADDKSVREIYVDRDLSHWEGPNRQRRINIAANPSTIGTVENTPDPISGLPSLTLRFEGAWAASAGTRAEAYYDTAGLGVGRVFFDAAINSLAGTGGNWGYSIATTDDQITFDAGTTFSPPVVTAIDPANSRRYLLIQFLYATGPTGSDGAPYELFMRRLAVYGRQGLAYRAYDDAEPWGFYDIDIIDHALGRWCPLLTVTDESLTAAPFIIPHAVFSEPTTVLEIIRQVNRFQLRDWAVWDDKTFWLHDRGATGRSWRARVGPSGLEETGPQVDRLWNSVIVQYQDVDRSTRTVGPVGSGSDTETDDLKDDDPDNPANKLGITRRDLLAMGVSTVEGATEVGRRFLEEQKRLDTSGRATLVGHVLDDRGVVHPYWKMRAGDTITFVDAADTSARRIVRAEHDHETRSCSVELDSPPEGLNALLEQLDVVLIPLGL